MSLTWLADTWIAEVEVVMCLLHCAAILAIDCEREDLLRLCIHTNTLSICRQLMYCVLWVTIGAMQIADIRDGAKHDIDLTECVYPLFPAIPPVAFAAFLYCVRSNVKKSLPISENLFRPIPDSRQQATDVELQNVGGPDHIISYNINGQVEVAPAAESNELDQGLPNKWNGRQEMNQLNKQNSVRTPVQPQKQPSVLYNRPVTAIPVAVNFVRDTTPNPNSRKFSWSRSWRISPNGQLNMQIYDRKRGQKVETKQLSPEEMAAWRVTPVPYEFRRG
uniref:Uncharacterized protein n=1 Tax=Ditylenchus dipsaci TaxID=166011 RepID=A0A915CZA3_9BILA